MKHKPLSYYPRDCDLDYLEKTGASHTDITRWAYDIKIGLVKKDWLDKVSNHMLLVILGCGFLAFSYMIGNFVPRTVMIVSGAVSIVIGIVGIFLEVINGRR